MKIGFIGAGNIGGSMGSDVIKHTEAQVTL